ncbi:MAG: hypothetical protein CMB57_00050 [Euryarchaeota archaeon]|nr:hypothetical protein [Euryarchaeota archaeon]|tara:strand:+ start:240 stop:1301 length:1062 start_codon:yes stop_codon:yes gene_type:complete
MAYLTNDKVQEAIAKGHMPHVIDANSLECYKVSEFVSWITGSTEAICRFAEYLLSRPLERRYMHSFSDLWILVVENRGIGEDVDVFWKGALSSEQHTFFEKNKRLVVAYMLISEDADNENIKYIEWQDSIVRGFGLAARLRFKAEEELRLRNYKPGDHYKDVMLHPRDIIFPAAGYHFKREIESVFEYMDTSEDDLKPFYQDGYDIEGLIEFFKKEHEINPKETNWKELGDWMQWILNWKSVLTDETLEEGTYPHPFKNLPERHERYSVSNLFEFYAEGSFQTPEDITRFVERALDRLHSVYKLFGIIRMNNSDSDDTWDAADIASADKICEIVRRNTTEYVRAFHTEYCVET